MSGNRNSGDIGGGWVNFGIWNVFGMDDVVDVDDGVGGALAAVLLYTIVALMSCRTLVAAGVVALVVALLFVEWYENNVGVVGTVDIEAM